MICEEWRDVRGFEGIFQISSLGRIKSFRRNRAGRILKITDRSGRYLAVNLSTKGRDRKTAHIHRLVAEAFIPNPDALAEINHKDGNKQNNAVENLEWCTHSHNIRHSIQMHPRQLVPMIQYNQEVRPKTVQQITKAGEIVGSYRSAADASRATGICARTILNVAQGATNHQGYKYHFAGGYIWRFESEATTA